MGYSRIQLWRWYDGIVFVGFRPAVFEYALDYWDVTGWKWKRLGH